MATATKSGRKSTAHMEPLSKTREQLISSLIATGGMTNDQVFAFFEAQNPSFIKPDDGRRVAGLVKEPFDVDGRAKLGRAVRSVRGLMQKARMDTDELSEVLGAGAGRSARDVPYENIKRWDTGDPVMNDIHGITEYVWILPDELKNEINRDTGEKWNYGDLIPKRFLNHMNPLTGNYEPDNDFDNSFENPPTFGDKTGHVEVGIAESWIDVEGGEQGVGKSRHKIAVMKSLCNMYPDRVMLYNYGESNLPQLRKWIGTEVPKNFIVSEHKTSSGLMAEIYKQKPLAVVQDSLQTLLDARTSSGMYEVVSIFKALVTEEAAGKPHMFLISQLNKKKELRGSSELGFLVDSVYRLFKAGLQDNGEFIYESTKNRGAACPKGARYKHTPTEIVCLGSGTKSKPFNLTQTTNQTLADGISSPKPVKV